MDIFQVSSLWTTLFDARILQWTDAADWSAPGNLAKHANAQRLENDLKPWSVACNRPIVPLIELANNKYPKDLAEYFK